MRWVNSFLSFRNEGRIPNVNAIHKRFHLQHNFSPLWFVRRGEKRKRWHTKKTAKRKKRRRMRESWTNSFLHSLLIHASNMYFYADWTCLFCVLRAFTHSSGHWMTMANKSKGFLSIYHAIWAIALSRLFFHNFDIFCCCSLSQQLCGNGCHWFMEAPLWSNIKIDIKLTHRLFSVCDDQGTLTLR